MIIELSQADMDKVDSEFLTLLLKLQMYLISEYDSISRADAKRLIIKEVKRFMESQ